MKWPWLSPFVKTPCIFILVYFAQNGNIISKSISYSMFQYKVYGNPGKGKVLKILS